MDHSELLHRCLTAPLARQTALAMFGQAPTPFALLRDLILVLLADARSPENGTRLVAAQQELQRANFRGMPGTTSVLMDKARALLATARASANAPPIAGVMRTKPWMEAKEALDGMGMARILADERAARAAVAVVATVEMVAVPTAAGAAPKTETDTFLRLSDVEFCEGVGTLESGGASSELSVTSNEAFGTSTGGGRSGGGVENGTVLSRHLSDFFRSPLSLDSPPVQRFSSIRSLSDVQTGARLFNSVRSVRSEDDKPSRKSGSGKLSDSVSCVRASGATTGDTADDISTGLGVGVIVDGEESPRCSPPSAVSDSAASLLDPLSPHGGATNDHSTPPPIPANGTEDVLVKENVDTFPKTAVDPVLEEHLFVSDAVATFKPLETIEREQERAAGIGDESGGGGGGGRESEEEWLSHPEEEADTAPAGPGDWIGRALEATLVSKRAEAAPQCVATGCVQADNPETAAAVAEGERGGEEDAGAGAGHVWAGLNDDGSWRTEVARRAAGEAGAVEAERRRLAKVKADESWRSDAAGEGHGAPRRDSVSFTQLQTGNVRDKLNVFEGASGSKVGKEKPGNRSSVGALHGRGLVTAWAKKTTDHHPASTAINEQDSSGWSPPPPWSTGGRTRSPPPRAGDSDEQEEFTWKAGPSPCRLKGRPSLGLIRNGQVRIMSKALLMSCPEGRREGGGTPTHLAGGRADGGMAAARAKGASGAWAKLHRRLEEESKNFNGTRRAEVVPPVVTSG
ncbi:unnamed protein product [Ectocarpus sp. CCAP 1310/34]|nr:unnamed protein product [Ectocarpus sp. CCAP 1310/34]